MARITAGEMKNAASSAHPQRESGHRCERCVSGHGGLQMRCCGVLLQLLVVHTDNNTVLATTSDDHRDDRKQWSGVEWHRGGARDAGCCSQFLS